MQISLANAKKLNWLWKDENEIAWIETFIKAYFAQQSKNY